MRQGGNKEEERNDQRFLVISPCYCKNCVSLPLSLTLFVDFPNLFVTFLCRRLELYSPRKDHKLDMHVAFCLIYF